MTLNHHFTAPMTRYPRINRMKSAWNQLRNRMLQKVTTHFQNKYPNTLNNPYLRGVFAPVEEVWVEQLQVRGEIPKMFNGILLRIGPNPMAVKHSSHHHWFAGDGMLHGLRLQQGQAEWFKSTYIATDSIQKQREQPIKPGFRRGPSDVVNTNAFLYADKIWALIEAGTYPVCLDFELNTLSHQLFNSDADLPFTAHPHQDLKTGHMHAICYDALNREQIFYEVFDAYGKLVHYAPIPVEHGPMIHDCAITEQDVLVFDLPVTFSAQAVLQGSNLPYVWNEQHQARIGILPHYGLAEDIHWLEIEPCYVFHMVNAYREEGHRIVVDLIVHSEMFKASTQGPFDPHQTQLERWEIDLNLNQIDRQVLDEEHQEFPRIDERYTGQAHRYIYSVSYDACDMSKANALLCHDVETNEKVRYAFGDQWLSGEVIFIPAHPDAAQGEGYLLSYVHHIDGQHASKVVILKVHGTEIALQVEIDLGLRVPVGFHTNWADLSRYT